MDSNKTVTELEDEQIKNVSGGASFGFSTCSRCKTPLIIPGFYCPNCNRQYNNNVKK